MNKLVFLLITPMILLSCKNCNNKVAVADKLYGAGGGSPDSTAIDSTDSQFIEEDSSQINATHLSLTTCSPDPHGMGSLIDSIIFQKTTEWCWAASGEMVMKQLGTIATQCDQANKRLGRNDCCGEDSIPGDCVVPGLPEFDKYGFLFNRTESKALNWDDVKTQIACQNAPFCWTKQYTTIGGAHMMVISGYEVDSIGVKHVYVLDPWPVHSSGVARLITYAEYVTSQDGSYTHGDDFYNIRKE